MRELFAHLNARRRGWQEARAGRAAAPPQVPAGAAAQTVMLGETPVLLACTDAGRAGPLFVSLHENEQTSVQAAHALLPASGGRLLELKARGRRLVAFRIEGRWQVFDPNRIFTPAGLRGTLARHGSPDLAAADAVGRLRDAVLAQLQRAAPAAVVALHNNRGGRYSVLQYLAGGDHARDAAAVWAPRPAKPEDFFVLTQRGHCEALAARGFNCVLQADAPADDGSLSVWSQGRTQPYVNLETREGRVDEARAMLAAVCEVLAG